MQHCFPENVQGMLLVANVMMAPAGNMEGVQGIL
jgi:hypothetical protein